MPRLAALLLLVIAMLLAACGGADENTAAPETVTVVQERVTVAQDSEPEQEPEVEVQDAAASEATAGGGEGDNGGDITVPDVVGEDHQLAQDTMQAAGLYNLSEEDATGQGRMLIIDRNWTVVEQSPPAGSKVSEDATIVLRSKKDDE